VSFWRQYKKAWHQLIADVRRDGWDGFRPYEKATIVVMAFIVGAGATVWLMR